MRACGSASRLTFSCETCTCAEHANVRGCTVALVVEVNSFTTFDCKVRVCTVDFCSRTDITSVAHCDRSRELALRKAKRNTDTNARLRDTSSSTSDTRCLMECKLSVQTQGKNTPPVSEGCGGTHTQHRHTLALAQNHSQAGRCRDESDTKHTPRAHRQLAASRSEAQHPDRPPDIQSTPPHHHVTLVKPS